jgi:hypothetical protein
MLCRFQCKLANVFKRVVNESNFHILPVCIIINAKGKEILANKNIDP